MTTRNSEPLPAVAPAEEVETRNSRRSRKLYILWAIALTLLISTALFCWLVVVPVRRMDAALERCVIKHKVGMAEFTIVDDQRLDREITALGGKPVAACWAARYLRMPKRFASRRWEAVRMLARCGSPAVPALQSVLEDENPELRQAAAEALEEIKSSQKKASK
jgi:HEAT repeat protein